MADSSPLRCVFVLPESLRSDQPAVFQSHDEIPEKDLDPRFGHSLLPEDISTSANAIVRLRRAEQRTWKALDCSPPALRLRATRSDMTTLELLDAHSYCRKHFLVIDRSWLAGGWCRRVVADGRNWNGGLDRPWCVGA